MINIIKILTVTRNLLGVLGVKKLIKIPEENTKKITAVSVVLYVIKFHVNLHKL